MAAPTRLDKLYTLYTRAWARMATAHDAADRSRWNVLRERLLAEIAAEEERLGIDHAEDGGPPPPK
jgi:hypothetical protein